MNTTIMAERQAKALMAIEAEVARLGGRLEGISGRAPNPQVKHTLQLEAVAAALAGIGAGGGVEEGEVVEDPSAPRQVEPVEAIISVVKETPAPKGKRGKPEPDSDDWAKSGRGKEVGS